MPPWGKCLVSSEDIRAPGACAPWPGQRWMCLPSAPAGGSSRLPAEAAGADGQDPGPDSLRSLFCAAFRVSRWSVPGHCCVLSFCFSLPASPPLRGSVPAAPQLGTPSARPLCPSLPVSHSLSSQSSHILSAQVCPAVAVSLQLFTSLPSAWPRLGGGLSGCLSWRRVAEALDGGGQSQPWSQAAPPEARGLGPCSPPPATSPPL